jgi:hypothetical protein
MRSPPRAANLSREVGEQGDNLKLPLSKLCLCFLPSKILSLELNSFWSAKSNICFKDEKVFLAISVKKKIKIKLN